MRRGMRAGRPNRAKLLQQSNVATTKQADLGTQQRPRYERGPECSKYKEGNKCNKRAFS